MNKQLSFHLPIQPTPFCWFWIPLFFLPLLANAQSWQQTYPNLNGYEFVQFLKSANYQVQLKDGPINGKMGVDLSNGTFLNFTTTAPDCDFSAFGADININSNQFFDYSITSAGNLRLRRGTNVPAPCGSLGTVYFDEEYPLPVADETVATSIAYDIDYNAVFIGGVQRLSPVSVNTEFNIFIKKINVTTGQLIWSYSFPNNLTVSGTPPSVRLKYVSQNGGVVFTLSNPSLQPTDLYGINWDGQKKFGPVLIGSPLTQITDVQESADGGVMVSSFLFGGSGPSDAPSFAKYDANGNLIFNATPGSIIGNELGTFMYQLQLQVALDLPDGGVLLVGKSDGSIGLPGNYLMRISPTGTTKWVEFYPGLGVDFKAAKLFPTGELLFGGMQNGEVFLMKTNGQGQINPPPPACTNLIPNPSFENDLQGWSTSGEVTITADANTGFKAAEICGLPGSVGQIGVATPGTTYTGSVWGKYSGNPDYFTSQLRFLNSSYMPLPGAPIALGFNSNTDYVNRTYSAIAPPDAAFVHLIVYKENNGCVLVDDFEICEETSGLPDLTIANLMVNSSSVQQGQVVTHQFIVQNNGSAPASGFQMAAYASPTPSLTTNSTLLATSTASTLNVGASQSYALGAVVPDNLPPGDYYFIVVVDGPDAITESEENNNIAVSSQTFEVTGTVIVGPGGQIDVSLTLEQLDASPVQWGTYQVKATVSNEGPQTATSVRVKFAKPSGVVYVGGNEYTASQGTFDPNGNESWNVGSIPAGESATLTVNYFLLNTTAPVSYAQVTTHNETDSDSQPNNGTPPTPNQDDEASTDGSGPPNLIPDLTVTDLQIPNASVDAGEILYYNFDASNIGTGAVPGNFTIKSYISTDNILSGNDIQDGLIQTGNFDAGYSVQNVPGASTIPANLAAGQYYLIVKIDADEVVMESNEGNNIVAKPFTIGTICQGDLILESQAEVDAVPNCSIVDGDLIIGSPFDFSDIHDLSPLLGIEKVNGGLRILQNPLLQDLQGLNNLASVGGVIDVARCNNLTNILALSSITGEIVRLNIIENESLGNLDGLEGITYAGDGLGIQGNAMLQNINGLSNISGTLQSEITVSDNPALVSIEGLQNIIGVNAPLLIERNASLQNLEGLNNFSKANVLVLFDNPQLQNITALGSLSTITDVLYVKNNALLNDCCTFYNLLNNNGVGGSATFEDNAGDCNSAQGILDNCANYGNPCNAITITPAPGQITIAGASAPHVLIKVFRPNWTVAFECLDSCPSSTVVDGLSAGPHYIQVKLIDQSWGEICYLEQTVDLTNFGGSGGTSLKTKNSRQRMAFDNIYPNPAKYVVTLEIYSKDKQSSVLDFYNQQGQSVHRMEVDLAIGLNKIELDVSQWKSGAYNVIGRSDGHPAYGRFLKVWED